MHEGTPEAQLRMEAQRLIYRTVDQSASFSFASTTMNVLATVIACYGLLSNSPAVVIGAMVVAMLLNPILGVALGLAASDNALIRKSAISMAGGFTVVFATAFAIGVLHRHNPITAEIMARTDPGLFDLIIALAGGAAGAYAMVSPSLSVAFVGIAIATALVPPLACAAMLLARSEVALALKSLLLVGTNIVAIQFAASVVIWLSGFRKITRLAQALPSFAARDAPSMMVILILGALFARHLSQTVARASFEAAAHGMLEEAVSSWPGAHLVEVRFDRTGDHVIVRAVTRAPLPPSKESVAELETRLQQRTNDRAMELRVRSMNTVVVNRDGVLYGREEHDGD